MKIVIFPYTLGNWKITRQLTIDSVEAICLTCNNTRKVCSIETIKKKPSAKCMNCYRKASKLSRSKWAWGGK